MGVVDGRCRSLKDCVRRGGLGFGNVLMDKPGLSLLLQWLFNTINPAWAGFIIDRLGSNTYAVRALRVPT
jgi:hypothetical protein